MKFIEQPEIISDEQIMQILAFAFQKSDVHEMLRQMIEEEKRGTERTSDKRPQLYTVTDVIRARAERTITQQRKAAARSIGNCVPLRRLPTATPK